jgi:hypothetical protein
MATVLIVWELGAGLGHVMRLAPLANQLVARGHRVFAAMRALHGTTAAFHPAVRLLPAPFRTGRVSATPTRSFTDILREVTFGDDATLAAHVAAWRNLFDLVRPDAIAFDHSPTALLAARGLPVRRVVLGTGFTVPPDVCPLPDLQPWLKAPPVDLRGDEDQLLRRANRILKSNHQPALDRLGQLYSGVDQSFLATFPELDPYAAARGPNERFWGAANADGAGAAPVWPSGSGKKVFCYLRAFPALVELIKFLRESDLPILIYGDVDASVKAEFATPKLVFAAQRLDLEAVGRECDLQVMNSGHGTVASVLMAGKPSLQLPLYLEQALNARAVRRMRAGLDAPIKDAAVIVDRLKGLLETDGHADGARRFARRHAQFDHRRKVVQMTDRAVAVLTS